jgi:hypothetical protein
VLHADRLPGHSPIRITIVNRRMKFQIIILGGKFLLRSPATETQWLVIGSGVDGKKAMCLAGRFGEELAGHFDGRNGFVLDRSAEDLSTIGTDAQGFAGFGFITDASADAQHD